MALPEWITIGELARRTGVATSAVRFYESRGLVTSVRNDGNQRRFPRSAIRRVSVIRAAQRSGLSLKEIGAALATLPAGREANHRDWERLSAFWRTQLEERISLLQGLRDQLSSCIGCGCLSLERCALLNQDDIAGRRGPGAQYL